jgi:MFS family permease
VRIKFTHVPRAKRQHWLQDLRQGWTEVRSRHWLRNLIVGSAVFNVLFAVYMVLGPDVSRQSYHGAATWTAAVTAGAVASVLIGLAASRIKPRRPLRLAIPASGLLFLAPLAFGLLLPVPVVVLAAALGGAGLQLFTILWQTTFQTQVPEEMLSRVASFSWFGALIAYPAGLAIAGPLAAAAGVRTVLVVVGCVIAVETVLLASAPSVRNLSSARPQEPSVTATGGS